MSEEDHLSKAYDAKRTDPKWLQFWEEHDFFHADPSSDRPPFSVVIPPPNVTSSLHMGHALVNTLQDILIRWKRMSGFETLWMPGTDHAGIATQTVVERHLIQSEGKKRSDYKREDFIKIVWNWKEEKEHLILDQLKKIGCSCDWDRLRFTMDEGCNQAVRNTFKQLFDQGLIYRGDYLVNWDPVSQTAIADDEVEYEDRSSSLWYFNYPLEDGSGHITIATTRPETMLGDTAVAVSPKDERYKEWIGKTVQLPLMNRSIPIIADRHVDPEFGTGALKITPAHDPNDYQIGQDHDLPMINIMTPDGKINENGGGFSGLSMTEARKAVVDAMKEQGFLNKIEPHINRVGVSYRSKATIEPYLSKQWFVKMEGFTKTLREVVTDQTVQIIPKQWESTYFHWIDNLRDWCISRQLWWGHRIPIWYRKDDPQTMICHDGEGNPPEVEKEPDAWEQDPDVLDTWFSAALWPFSTMGWPENTSEFEKFYPNSVLVTGHDILFFWVARMIAFGTHFTGQAPFPEVFLHGLIYGKSYWRTLEGGGIQYEPAEEQRAYDLGKAVPKGVESKWEKMSKSKGNIIDPVEIIDEYGTDAMRMGLASSPTQSREIDLDRRKFEEFRNFSNKVWNGARFVLMNLGELPEKNLPALSSQKFAEGIDPNNLQLEDKWILTLLSNRIDSVNEHLTHYRFDQAAHEAYEFFWNEFCAYYVEISKPALFGKRSAEERLTKQKILLIVLTASVRLLHPMAPFITEELFHSIKNMMGDLPGLDANWDHWTRQTIGALQAKSCCVAPFPVPAEERYDDSLNEFEAITSIIYQIRNIRGEMQLPPSTTTDLYLYSKEKTSLLTLVEAHQELIRSLVRIQKIFFETPSSDALTSEASVDGVKVIIPFPAERIEAEKKRLDKEEEKLVQLIEQLEKQLSNERFVEKAPEKLVQDKKRQLQDSKDTLTSIQLKKSTLS